MASDDNFDELVKLTRELDTAMMEGMTKYNLSPLSISAVILARLSFLNTVGRGTDGLHDYYDLLEHHSENVYKQWEVMMDAEFDPPEQWMNDNQKSADIIQFPRKDNDQ